MTPNEDLRGIDEQWVSQYYRRLTVSLAICTDLVLGTLDKLPERTREPLRRRLILTARHGRQM